MKTEKAKQGITFHNDENFSQIKKKKLSNITFSKFGIQSYQTYFYRNCKPNHHAKLSLSNQG